MNEQNQPKSTPKIIEKVAKHCGKNSTRKHFDHHSKKFQTSRGVFRTWSKI